MAIPNSNLCSFSIPQSNNTASLLLLQLFIPLGFQKIYYSDHSFIMRYLLWPLGFPLGLLLILYASHLCFIHSLIWINYLNYLLYNNNFKSLSLILTSLWPPLSLTPNFKFIGNLLLIYAISQLMLSLYTWFPKPETLHLKNYP